jgi:hypothetical protein
MADTLAPKGTKPGTKVTFADGSTGYVTEGGKYRIDSGPSKGKLWSGAVPGAAPAAGAAPAPGGTVAVENTTPSNMSPAGTAFLSKTKGDLQAQVAGGAINQLQADQEYSRREQQVSSASPEIQDAMWNLQQQVMSGAINQAQADNEVYRQTGLQNQTQPNTNVNIDGKSPSGAVINQIADVAKGSAMAGNVLSNPNQKNDFGSQTVSVDPITGQPLVQQQLSDANKQSLQGIQGTGVQASQVAQGLLGNQYGQFVQGAGPQSGYSDPALEKSIYDRLTRDYGDRFGREEEQLSQTLANRGIPVGSEAYTNAMKDFRTNRDTQYETAANNATMQGSQTALARQQNNVGALGAMNTGVGTLAGVGQAGLYQPNFQGFNAVNYNQPDVQSLYGTQFAGDLTREGYDTQLEQQRIQIGAMKGLGGGGGGGGGSPAPAPSAFTTKPPGS